MQKNKSFQQLNSVTENIVNYNGEINLSIHSEDRDRVLKAIENAVATGSDYNLKFRIVYPNGRIRWTLSQGKIVDDRNRQPIQMPSTDLEVTEYKPTDYYINEHRLQCRNGSYKWILDRGQALWDDAGNPVRMADSHTDITERKAAEEKLRLLESVIVNANDAVLITEAEPIEKPGPRIIYVNQAFTNTSGVN